jgi:hypothetical protein
LALPATASAEVTAGADDFKFVPIIKKVIPVLRNDAGDGLHIVGHTAAGHGTVDCDASTCTYTPPARAFPPDDDSDGIVAPDQNDNFSYTVADSTDQQATGLVTLTAVKPVAHVHRGKVGSSSRCTRSTKPRKPDPKRKASDTPGQGGSIVYGLAVCKHKKPASNTPPYTPQVNVPATQGALAVASLRASKFPGGWSANCTFTGGSSGYGGFNIHEWIGENGSTGVNRFTIRFRQQVYGENGFGTLGWSTLESTDWAANYKYPDSWNSWFPANRDHYWVYAWGRGDETLVEGYMAFRMQVRVQWIHRRDAPLPDKKIIDPGWLTRCQGQPHVRT